MKHLVFLLVLISFSRLNAQDSPNDSTITVNLGNRRAVVSESLNESREFLVHLPAEYSSSQAKYPVLYVLDGETHFIHAVNTATILSRAGRIPPTIVVGIPNKETSMRDRDFALEREAFRIFLNEVIELIDSEYRSSSIRTLFGHSLAASFALNFLTSEPEVFHNVIAASPSIPDMHAGFTISDFETLFKNAENLDKIMYLTMTDVSQEGLKATTLINEILEYFGSNAPEGFNWHFAGVAGLSHMTTGYVSLYTGLSYAFRDYPAPMFIGLTDFEEFGGLAGLEAFYAGRGQKYDAPTDVPENTLMILACVLIQDSHPDIALLILKDRQPTFGLYDLQGDAYAALGDIDQAVEAYQKAAELAVLVNPVYATYFSSKIESVSVEKR